MGDLFITSVLTLDIEPLLAEVKFSAEGGFAGRSFDNTTTVHPIGFLILVACNAYILVARTQGIALAFLVLMCFVSSAQRIVLFGVDFDFGRILVITSILRFSVGMEWRSLRLNSLDMAVIAWSIIKLVAFSLLWLQATKTQWMLGQTLDTLGLYLVFRIAIKSREDVTHLVKAMAWFSLPVAAFFVYEALTRYNLFSIFGGVRAITVERQGKLRCQGAFSHPVVAGCFWAATLPLLVFLYSQKRLLLASLGSLACVVIVVACSSSTPVFGVLMAAIGLSFWFAKPIVRPTLYAIAVLLPILHFVMEGPVWHLISRVSAVGGSTGWHRYNLIDQAINRFPEWALFGTKSTLHWGHFLFDVANYYVYQGVFGGIATLASFITILVIGFRYCGRYPLDDNSARFLSWCLGVSLMVHCANFIGLAYFGQITSLLFIHLACVASIPSWESSTGFRGIDECDTLSLEIDSHSD